MLSLCINPDASGLSTARPAATAVSVGYIYYSTDIDSYSLSNGAAWQYLPTLQSQSINRLNFTSGDLKTLLFNAGPITKTVYIVVTGATLTPSCEELNALNTAPVITSQVNTEALGTLTIAAPLGTPTDAQQIVIRLKSTNVQTYSWNAIYRGSVSAALETASSGGDLTDYLLFQYNATDTKWDYMAAQLGF